jgi:hypothetical protein
LVHTLRNLAALALLTPSFGVLALWVRSYSCLEILETRINLHAVQISSVKGCIAFALIDQRVAIGMSYLNVVAGNAADWRLGGVLGFAYYEDGLVTALIPPHWFVALFLAALAFALKPKPRLKFSLADLLILMTFSAVLIAGVAGLTRLAS